MSQNKQNKRLCLAYAAGPGDIVGTFSYWHKGMDDPNQVAVTYSSLFFDACRTLGAKGIAISSCSRKERIATEQFYVENLPKGPVKSGIAFHVQQVRYVIKIIMIVVSKQADILIMADSTGYFFPFLWFAPRSLQIVPSLHCTLWPKSRESSITRKIISFLNRDLFSRRASAILCLSEDIHRQLLNITGNKTASIYPFIPHYRKELFKNIPPPPSTLPFNLLYAGRIEKEKGIFDLLEIAFLLKQAGNTTIAFHLCGNGSEDEELRNAIVKKGVESIFHLHGYCQQEEMFGHISRSHAFIVPTRSSFEEGFNKVVAESILAGRPVITSSVCPALDYVREAVLEVPPDDIPAYLDAVIKLSSCRKLYLEKQIGCKNLQEQFYDPDRSWGAALLRILNKMAHG